MSYILRLNYMCEFLYNKWKTHYSNPDLSDSSGNNLSASQGYVRALSPEPKGGRGTLFRKVETEVSGKLHKSCAWNEKKLINHTRKGRVFLQNSTCSQDGGKEHSFQATCEALGSCHGDGDLGEERVEVGTLS